MYELNSLFYLACPPGDTHVRFFIKIIISRENVINVKQKKKYKYPRKPRRDEHRDPAVDVCVQERDTDGESVVHDSVDCRFAAKRKQKKKFLKKTTLAFIDLAATRPIYYYNGYTIIIIHVTAEAMFFIAVYS